jgi:hypothetical protein
MITKLTGGDVVCRIVQSFTDGQVVYQIGEPAILPAAKAKAWQKAGLLVELTGRSKQNAEDEIETRNLLR